MTGRSLRGLYAVTPEVTGTAALLHTTEALLRGGVRLLQYRSKHDDAATCHARATALRALTHSHGARLIINDDVALAAACGADGVHLGRDDGSVAEARIRLGAHALIGASCYNDLARARDAATAGADYLAFGAMFDSPTKPAAVRCPLATLQAARRLFALPIACIGGITLDRAPEVLAAGADLLAVITDLYAAADPESRARAYARLLDPEPSA